MHILDTNHCSRLMDGHSGLREKMIAAEDQEFATCAIVQGELEYMAERSQQKAANLRKVRNFLKDLEIYPVDGAAAQVYGTIKSRLLAHFAPRQQSRRQKVELHEIGFQENDLWIAAVALDLGGVVISADRDFLRIKEAIPQLITDNWLGEVR